MVRPSHRIKATSLIHCPQVKLLPLRARERELMPEMLLLLVS